jgi:hypothetical protein
MIRLLLLLLSFSIASKELKPLEELLNVEMDVNTGTIFLLKKCAGLATLLSDEDGDNWSILSTGFLRSAVWFYLEDEEQLNSEETKKILDLLYPEYLKEVYDFAEEYGASVRNINPEDYEGKPPAFQLLDDDVTLCLEVAEMEIVKNLTDIDITNQ